MTTASSWVFETERLLVPISGAAPAGELLRYEGTYDRINEARRSDDAHLAMGVWEHDLKEADWTRVSEICLESLEKRSKDLQIAAWMLEAWIHLHGFAGAREGLKAIGGLCGVFWDAMHPPMEDPEYRLSIFEWINDKLSFQLKFIPITAPPQAVNGAQYCFADWEDACEFEKQTRKGSEKSANPKDADKTEVTISDFQKSAVLTPAQSLESLAEDIQSAKVACVELEAFLDRTYGKDSPSLRGFRNMLETIHSLIEDHFGLSKPAPAGRALPAMEGGSAPRPQDQKFLPEFQGDPPGSPIQSRAEAYQRLAEAAEYLLRTEPHSPTPYLVRKAIAWGNMGLDELLPELVRNESALEETLKLLQIESRKQPASVKAK